MAAGAHAQVAERFLLVDPLDGTREFLAGNGEFTINVALIERALRCRRGVCARDRPVVGGGETAFTCEALPGAELPGKDRGGASELVGAPAS